MCDDRLDSPPRQRHNGRLPGAALALVLSLSIPGALAADKEKKEEKKPEPPRVIVALPLAVTAGTTNLVRVRGNSLAEVTDVRFTNASAHATVRIKSTGKVDVPRDQEARKVGDTQVELELSFPPATTPETNYFIVTSTNGASAAHAIIALPAGALTDEKEPNGGMDKAQTITSGAILHGTFREEADVDMFRFEGKAGQWLVAEVYSARLGAPTDPILTLHGAGGFILAESDDAPGHRDALLRYRLPTDRARYYLSLIDAHLRGGPAYAYVLNVRLE